MEENGGRRRPDGGGKSGDAGDRLVRVREEEERRKRGHTSI
jgi:hypothetical protein